MLSKNFLSHIEKQLSGQPETRVTISASSAVTGGSINETYRLETSAGVFFMKVNDAKAYPDMFEAEAKGLELLKKHCRLQVPKPFLHGNFDDKAFLLMEFLEKGKKAGNFWQRFGQRLADMHRHEARQFGLHHNNYIGSLQQDNTLHDSWSEFFIVRRLEPMIRMGNTDPETNRLFDKLFVRLDSFFPEEPPALLHGDLWSGNYKCCDDGLPGIFDPAVYYGHREMDLGMSRLFGGFDRSFYEAYQENYPMEKGWEKRLDIANLYPLMVHVNLFGGSYLASVKSILKQFI